MATVAPVPAFDLNEARVDLRPLFQSPARGEPEPKPLFGEMVIGDLTGGGSQEIVVPGTDGRLRILRLAGSGRRPELEPWAIVDTRVQGDAAAGGAHLTIAQLKPDEPARLVLALPQGVFAVQIVGTPPQVRFSPLCDRTFFDPERADAPPRRLDFLADLDADGSPELWLPQLEGMTFWRRTSPGIAWQRIALPPFPVRIRQTLGAIPTDRSAAQPAMYSLEFAHVHSPPALRLTDVDRDGRPSLVALTRERRGDRLLRRAACYRLQDALHFTTAPWQIRTADIRSGNEEFVDLNADGFLDLLRVDSNFDIIQPRTTIEAFLSPVVLDHTFARPPDGEEGRPTYFAYRTHDPIGMLLYGDWNGDGGVDLAFTQLEYSFGSTDDLVDLLLGSEVSVTVRFVYWQPYGYPAKPDQNLGLRIRNRCFNQRLFPPLSMEGDFNGSGGADLLVRSEPDRLRIHLAEAGAERIANRPAASVSIPKNAYVRIADFNGDGRSDLLAADPDRPALSVFLSRR